MIRMRKQISLLNSTEERQTLKDLINEPINNQIVCRDLITQCR